MQVRFCALPFPVRIRPAGRAALVALLAILWAIPAPAQKDTGTVIGEVKDSLGALVSGAQVTIHDLDRGTQITVTTNGSGEYVSGPLKVGRYKVTVEKQGFRREATEVEVEVQKRVPANFTLSVGQAVQEIQVTEGAAQVETETSELGQVVGRQQVSTLPLNGRNFAQLALLSTGTAPSEPGARDEGGYGFSASGARSLQNNFLLDGVDNNSNLPDLLNETNFVIQPPVEALEEFKVQTNAYSAEFGRGNGAIINAVIRSGTNQFHGSLWEFFRNEALDARYYFDQVRQPYKQSQFGGTFGGPIRKNRTFFFVDYEGLVTHRATPQVASVPTLAQRAGDSSSLIDYTSPVLDGGTGMPVLDCNGQPTYGGEIFNSRLAQPSAINPTGLCGMPFGYLPNGLPSNVIPRSLIDPLAARLTGLFPLPNAVNPGFNYIANPVTLQNRNNVDFRLDHSFSNSNTGFLRFSWEDQPSTFPSTFQATGGDGGGFFSGLEDNAYLSLAVSDTYTFRPTLINEFRFGYNHINSHRYQFNYNKDVSGQIGFPGVPFNSINGGYPQLNFSDMSTLGSPTFLPSRELQSTYVVTDNVTWVRGRHTLKFGTEIRAEEFTIFQPAESRGTMNFGSDFTGNPGTQSPVDAAGNALGSGSGYASFLLGAPDGGAINNMKNVIYHRPIYAFFVQDDWKATPRLTINLGLRYELFTTVKEKNNQQGTYDFASQSLILPKGQTAQLTPYLSTIIPVRAIGTPGLISPDLNNFAPRIGFAFAVYPTTVIRAGYGIFYGGQENGPYSNPSPGFNPPYFVTQQWTTPCSLSSTNQALASSGLDCAIPDLRYLQNGFPASALIDPNTPILYSIDPALRTPYMQQWHLGMQQQLPWNMVFELGYAGSRGLKLFTFLNGNQAAPTADPSIPLAVRRPVPSIDAPIQWFRSGGQSNYNSLQARLEKQFSEGLYFLVSYTWAHSLDDASNANLGAQNNGDFRNMRYPTAEYGNSDFDVRQRAVISYLYQLPFGQGQRFAGSANGAYNALIGGWQVGGILSFSTGNWFTVTSANGVSNADGGGNVGPSDRPDLIGDPTAKPCLPGTYFNTCAFTTAVPGTFGDVRRNTIQGPGYEIWDFSLLKNFAIREQQRLQFRVEFFNMLNHFNPLFARSGPQNANNATVFNPSNPGLFGVITAARPPRQIQLALKYSF
jgi:hypothetical protein